MLSEYIDANFKEGLRDIESEDEYFALEDLRSTYKSL